MLVSQLMTDVEMYLIRCMLFSKSVYVSEYYKRVHGFIVENRNMDECGLSERQMIWLNKIKKDLKSFSEKREIKRKQLRLIK